MSKPRSVKNYKSLCDDIKTRIRAKYPYGFDRDLITFKDHKGKFVTALPFETDTIYYLIKISRAEAHKLMLQNAEVEEIKKMKIDESMDMVIEEIPESVVELELEKNKD